MLLSVFVGLMCLPALPLSGHAAPAAGPSARASYTTLTATQWENRLLSRTNARRDARGCRALVRNSALVLAARRHTARMADARQLSHQLAGEASLGTRVTRAGYTSWRMLAENLAMGQSDPAAVIRAWVNSPSHRANLDNCRLRDVGFGVVIRNGRPWVTADLGRR